MDMSSLYVLAALIGYSFGSIPFGFILTRLWAGQDIRQVGSGNIGATNVLRTGNKILAFITLILDSFKGALAILIVAYWANPEAAALAGFAAVGGHCFPIWLRFKGGKGVATGIAVIATLSPITGIMMIGSWLFIALIFKISSLAALISFLAAAIYVLIWADILTQEQLAITAIALLSWLRHYQNIVRILQGREGRIHFGKPREAGK